MRSSSQTRELQREVDEVKAVLNLAAETTAPTYFEEWIAAVEGAPGVAQALVFVVRTLDPDHDAGYSLLLEHAAEIAMDLVLAGRLSSDQRQEVRAAFEGQLTSALFGRKQAPPSRGPDSSAGRRRARAALCCPTLRGGSSVPLTSSSSRP